MTLPTLREIGLLLPMLLPAIGGLWILCLVALQRQRDVRWPAAHAMIFLGLSAIWAILLLGSGVREEVLSGAIVIDRQAMAFHLVFMIVALLTVLSAAGHLQGEKIWQGEFFALILFAVCGMSVMASSENLLSIFVGLEILSICLYVLAGFTRDRVYAIEGALKYFLLGAFSTGFILYGMALFFGATGGIDLQGIAAAVAAGRGGEIDPLLLAGAGLLLIGMAFKVAAVPFHFWAPDVYQGSLAPVAGFMAAGTKAAAFATLLRIVTVGLSEPPMREQWIAIVSAIALLTMVVGNLIALAQQNIKRMLAYSSIANAGYLLVAVAAGGKSDNGSGAVLFYLAAYALMTVGAFAVVALIGRGGEGEQGHMINAYAGLSRRRPYLAAGMAIFMLSLTGIPPTAGFMGKFYIFKSAVDAEMYLLAVVGLVMSVVAAFYYLRVIVQMYLRDPSPQAAATPFSPSEALAIALASAGTLYIGLFPSQLFALAQLVL
jgi:NADH-quinone oxidoreductase subunit N